jgi:HD superfamily phosphohydrolase
MTKDEVLFGHRCQVFDLAGRTSVNWRGVLCMAALCHDSWHLPFSHAAEHHLLPEGWDHERITRGYG